MERRNRWKWIKKTPKRRGGFLNVTPQSKSWTRIKFKMIIEQICIYPWIYTAVLWWLSQTPAPEFNRLLGHLPWAATRQTPRVVQTLAVMVFDDLRREAKVKRDESWQWRRTRRRNGGGLKFKKRSVYDKLRWHTALLGTVHVVSQLTTLQTP